jgi:hypothetical protein
MAACRCRFIDQIIAKLLSFTPARFMSSDDCILEIRLDVLHAFASHVPRNCYVLCRNVIAQINHLHSASIGEKYFQNRAINHD